MKCKKCGKNVKDKTIIKHLWADHREYMMKNHKGGFSAKKKVEAVPDDRVEMGRDALFGLFQDTTARLNARADAHTTAGDAHLRSKFLANGKKLTVVVHQGQNKIELVNVTLVEMFE